MGDRESEFEVVTINTPNTSTTKAKIFVTVAKKNLW